MNARKEEYQNMLCSIHALTHHCLTHCTASHTLSRLTHEHQQCFAQCAKNMIEMRFHTKEKWMEDYSATEKRNNDVWDSYAK